MVLTIHDSSTDLTAPIFSLARVDFSSCIVLISYLFLDDNGGFQFTCISERHLNLYYMISIIIVIFMYLQMDHLENVTKEKKTIQFN